MKVWTCVSDAAETGELFHEFEARGGFQLDDPGIRKSLQKSLGIHGVCDDYIECWRLASAAVVSSFDGEYTTVLVPVVSELEDE